MGLWILEKRQGTRRVEKLEGGTWTHTAFTIEQGGLSPEVRKKWLCLGQPGSGFSAFYYFKKIHNYNKVINCFVIKYQNN